MISDSLYNYLSTDHGISLIAGTKVYPLLIPQQSYDEATKHPCLVYALNTDGRQVRCEGSDTLVLGRLEIACYSRSYAIAQNLAAAVRDALIDYSGAMAAATSPSSSVNVQKIFLTFEMSGMDEEPGLYRMIQRYDIWYDEA